MTLRVREHVWNLRSRRSLRVVEAALLGVRARDDFRVVQFSVQGNHLHLVVEAGDRRALGRGLKALSVRLARRLNRMMARRGAVFTDRYHAHALRSPREVRNALAYVLLNHRSHAARRGERPGRAAVDPFSSGATFDGWAEGLPAPRGAGAPAVTSRPRTWLLATGWRRRGLVSLAEVPAAPA